MPFIHKEFPSTGSATSGSGLVPTLVRNNPLNTTIDSTFSAYKASALPNSLFSCQLDENSKITNMQPADETLAVPARIVVGRTAGRITGLWCWRDRGSPHSADDCTLVQQYPRSDKQLLYDLNGQLEHITVLTGRQEVNNSSLIPPGQSHLYHCDYILETVKPLIECELPLDWDLILEARADAASRGH
jgi:hypothetical protein